MSTTPEAVKLADDLDALVMSFGMPGRMNTELQAAAELRRLAQVEAERDQLRAEVKALRADAERWRFIVDEALQDTRRDKGLGYYCVGVRVPHNGVMALAEQMDPGPAVDLAMQGMSVQEIRDALHR